MRRTCVALRTLSIASNLRGSTPMPSVVLDGAAIDGATPDSAALDGGAGLDGATPDSAALDGGAALDGATPDSAAPNRATLDLAALGCWGGCAAQILPMKSDQTLSGGW